MVVKTPSLFGHDNLLRARIWHAVNDKQRRRPLRSIRRGLPEQHHFVVYSRSSTGDGGNPSEAVLGIWTCNVPVQDNQGSVVQACNVPVREHQSSGSRRESEPTVSRVVSPPPFGAKLEEGALTAPEGAGGAKPFLRDERCDLSVDSGELRPANRARGRGVVTGPSRSVGSSSCSTDNDAARCTWVSVREDEAGPEDPVGVLGSGARVGGHKIPTRKGSFPLVLLEKGGEVANLIDSSAVRTCNVPIREHHSSRSRCESEPTVSRVVSPLLVCEKSNEDALAAPEGAGGAKTFLRDERCDLPVDLRELRPANRARGRGVITSLSRRVGSPSCSVGNDAARCTWVSVHEGEAGPEGPVGVFGNGARVGGHKRPTREGSFPLALTEKREEVANLIDYFFTGKRIERSLMSRGNTGSSPARNLGVLVLAFPHSQTERHLMVRKKRFFS